MCVVACSKHAAPPDSPPPPPPCTPFDLTIPVTTAGANPIWTGAEYVLLVSGREPFQPTTMDSQLQIVTSDGEIGATFATIPLSQGTIPLGQSLAWSGSVLAAALTIGGTTSSPTTFALVRFDGSGTQLGMTTLGTAMYGAAPQVVWAGDRFVVMWVDTTSLYHLDVVEVAEDGTVGTRFQATNSDVGGPFNEIASVSAIATSYAAIVNNNTAPFFAVLFDRTSGAVSHIQVDPTSMVGRDPVFALFGGDFAPFSFATITPPTTLGPPVTVPFQAVHPGFIATPTGYLAHGVVTSTTMSNTQDVEVLDLDASGSTIDMPITLGTRPQEGLASTGPVMPVWRDNGYAVVWSYGMSTLTTQRFVQRCSM